MSASARFAQTDYPGEVEDVVVDALENSIPLTCAAVGGYAIVASAISQRALIFAIAAGSSLDAIPIPLPPSNSSVPSPSPPALVAWLSEIECDSVQFLTIACLSHEGVLRIYQDIPVREPSDAVADAFKCDEIRVANSLVQSVGHESSLPCAALHMVHSNVEGFDQHLFVFGSRGSAALVTSSASGGLTVAPLHHQDTARKSSYSSERNSLRLGSMFYSALRSIGGGVGSRNLDFEQGTGPYEIVGSGSVASAPAAVIVRKGGDVERWGTEGMQWFFNVFEFVGGRDANKSVLSARMTTDDTLVLLIESRVQADFGRMLVCFDVRSEDRVPARTELEIPLNDGSVEEQESKCFMVVSGDIAYLYIGRNNMLAWLSVARGVSSEGQVQGSTSFDSNLNILCVVDASYGLAEAAVTGGVAACLHSGGVWLASSAVPAPISLDQEHVVSTQGALSDVSDVLWRGFLQYCADQRGAAKASLQGLVNSLEADGFDLEEALSDTVESISRKIITSDQDPDKAPMSLLVDTELEKKYQQHLLYMKLLSDSEVFNEVRPDAPSTTDDRIWDAIKVSSRYSVVTDGEKLAAARRIRDLENAQASGKFSQRFNDAASSSMMGSDAIKSSVMSIPGLDGQADQDAEVDVPNVLHKALQRAAEGVVGAKRVSSVDEATTLYRHPYEFEKFLPSLEQAMSEALTKLQSNQNVADDNVAVEGESYRLGARTIILVACAAAIAVVQGSSEARQEHANLLENGPNGLKGVKNWLCDMASCRMVLFKIAECALEVGGKIRQTERKLIVRNAALVVDELLCCGRLSADESTKTAGGPGATKDKMQMTPQKRRRIDMRRELSEWRHELRSALDLLRKSALNEDAFRLAEKYGDYGTMLSLRVSAANFDAFMENSLESFGDEFAYFAFEWLEERGELHLLLRGRSSNATAGGVTKTYARSRRLENLLSDYFRTERRGLSNLAWLHWISIGNMAAAAECLVDQTKKISIPGKKKSAMNAHTLNSIAKLAILAHSRNEIDMPMELANAESYVNGKLHLSRLQHRIAPGSEAVLSSDELIRMYVDEAPVETHKLAEHVILAVEAIQFAEVDDFTAQQLEDYVWRRCIERQGHFWMPILKRASSTSDTDLRQRLKATALFEAAGSVSLQAKSMDDMIERGAFEDSEFAHQGCLAELGRLLKTTVSLTMV